MQMSVTPWDPAGAETCPQPPSASVVSGRGHGSEIGVSRIRETGIPVPHSSVALFRHVFLVTCQSHSQWRGIKGIIGPLHLLQTLSHLVISSFKWRPPFCSYLFICLSPSHDKGLCFEFPTPSSRIGSYEDDNAMTLTMTNVYVVLFATLDAAFHLL